MGRYQNCTVVIQSSLVTLSMSMVCCESPSSATGLLLNASTWVITVLTVSCHVMSWSSWGLTLTTNSISQSYSKNCINHLEILGIRSLLLMVELKALQSVTIVNLTPSKYIRNLLSELTIARVSSSNEWNFCSSALVAGCSKPWLSMDLIPCVATKSRQAQFACIRK